MTAERTTMVLWLAGIMFILLAGAFAQFDFQAMAFACFACFVACWLTIAATNEGIS